MEDKEKKILEKMYEKFQNYYNKFLTEENTTVYAVKMKYDHTQRVIEEIKLLCKDMNFDSLVSLLAEVSALFHDVARFEQFKKFKTFSDRVSFNHAERAVEIIEENNFFADLEESDAKDIKLAIRYHNAYKIPETLNERATLLCKLLRDADKLDIYNIAVSYYKNPDEYNKNVMEIGVEKGEAVGDEVCKAILEGRIVPYSIIKTINDFKMVQLSWVYDIYFPHSLKRMIECGYIEEIKKGLPSSTLIAQAIEKIEKYIKERIEL